jgi:hypothetical protein
MLHHLIYHLNFIVGLVDGSFNMVFELEGLEFEHRPRISAACNYSYL